jgi:hypothetical protein
MSHLTKAACTLWFEEYEFIEFFGMVSHLDEDACSYSYDVKRDGLSLLFTVFPLDGGVYTSLFRDGLAEPIFTSRLQRCTHYRFVAYGMHRFLEVGRPVQPTSIPDVPLVWGLRLFVEPHFRLEFIHDRHSP